MAPDRCIDPTDESPAGMATGAVPWFRGPRALLGG